LTLKWKVIAGLVVVAAAGAGIGGYYHQKNKGVVEVQTGTVVRQDLASLVTASGEIKPRNYINIGANSMGRITDIYVKEGDAVRKGQLLARLESVQPESEVEAQQAGLRSSEAQSGAAEASLRVADENLRTAVAALDRSRAEMERTRLNFERSRQLYEEKLIARQDFDQRNAEFQAAEASVREAEARVDQMKAQRAQTAAQLTAAQRQVQFSAANLRRAKDLLDKTSAIAPLDGVVTNLPVRVGETVVPGIQNSPASLIMTIADMSLITAEVKVDETDIVNVTLGQRAEVTIDAMPERKFRGRVIEIGNTAILRSTGLAASQSLVASQEAKDFKVVVALENPPEGIRPGLSCTARVTTATRDGVLALPIQALTVRKRADLEAPPEDKGAVQAATRPVRDPKMDEDVQGVFIFQGDKAEFREVKTGISGATDTEVLAGLEEGARVITGPYKVIRTLRNGAKVKLEKPKRDTKS
jgi:HlyD family secretion protein